MTGDICPLIYVRKIKAWGKTIELLKFVKACWSPSSYPFTFRKWQTLIDFISYRCMSMLSSGQPLAHPALPSVPPHRHGLQPVTTTWARFFSTDLPKRPASAYLAFANEKRANILMDNPGELELYNTCKGSILCFSCVFLENITRNLIYQC